MINYNIEKDAPGLEVCVRELNTNIVRMSSLAKGDKFYIPKNPKWLVDVTDTNPQARARVLAIELLADGTKQVRPIFYNQLCRQCRKGKALAFADQVNTAVSKGGNFAFNKIAGGKILEVVDTKMVYEYVYDNGVRVQNEDGTYRTVENAIAYAFKISGAGNINDADMQNLINAYISENYAIVENS